MNPINACNFQNKDKFMNPYQAMQNLIKASEDFKDLRIELEKEKFLDFYGNFGIEGFMQGSIIETMPVNAQSFRCCLNTWA